MTNTRLINRYGAQAVTCARHAADLRACFFSIVREECTEAQCPRCADEAKAAALPSLMRAALLSPAFSHTRVPSLSPGHVYCYHRDERSPSGVMCAAVLDRPRFVVLYADLIAAGLIGSGASPLSPTEGR